MAKEKARRETESEGEEEGDDTEEHGCEEDDEEEKEEDEDEEEEDEEEEEQDEVEGEEQVDASGAQPKKAQGPINMKKLSSFKDKLERTGVVYMSRVPPYMKAQKIRHLLSDYGEIGRIYLTPEDPAIRKKRKAMGGNKKQVWCARGRVGLGVRGRRPRRCWRLWLLDLTFGHACSHSWTDGSSLQISGLPKVWPRLSTASPSAARLPLFGPRTCGRSSASAGATFVRMCACARMRASSLRVRVASAQQPSTAVLRYLCPCPLPDVHVRGLLHSEQVLVKVQVEPPHRKSSLRQPGAGCRM